MDDFYAARDNTMPPLPWPSIAPPFTHYFQPILDRLQHSPSSLEARDCGVLVEGKSDYYILNWFKKYHAPELDLNFLPVNGVTNASAVISLMLGWTKDFVLLCDSDEEGKAAMKRYQDKLPISVESFVEYEDVFGVGKKQPKEIEDLLSEDVKSQIADHFGAKRWSKSQVQKYFSAALVGAETVTLDTQTLDQMRKLALHLIDAIERRKAALN